jgi:hypothetical protein
MVYLGKNVQPLIVMWLKKSIKLPDGSAGLLTTDIWLIIYIFFMPNDKEFAATIFPFSPLDYIPAPHWPGSSTAYPTSDRPHGMK